MSEYANDITKENLYAAYKKLFGRYHKNKNKYLELNGKFKQMLLTHDKDKVRYIVSICYVFHETFALHFELDNYDKSPR